jgi:short-subunit dehydrogenase
MINKVVIVTGASSGIGLATAKAFVQNGARVVLAARSIDKLKAVVEELTQAGAEVHAVQADVKVESDCKKLVDETVNRFGGVDVLINNAGISMRAIFEELDLKVMKEVMDVNFWGTVYCTKYALPFLLKSKGSVVGVSSIAGYVGLPARTAYSASKYGMQGFLDALRTENRKTGLHVLVACPGYTASNIRKSALNAEGQTQDETPKKEEKLMQAEEVATHILNAVKRRKRTLVLTFEGKMAVFLSKFFPNFIDGMVFKKVTGEKDSPIKT